MNHYLLSAKAATLFALAPVALATLLGTPAIERVTGSPEPQTLLSSGVSLPSFEDSVKTATLPESGGRIASTALSKRRLAAPATGSREGAEARAVAIAERMKVAIREDGLPLGALTVHAANSAVPSTGLVAVVLPQKHRAPGSAVASGENDQAVVVQRQLESVISHLTETSKVRHVLVEGETYGPVSTSTTNNVTEKLEALESARTALADVEYRAGGKEELRPAIMVLSEALDAAEREAFLAGASYVARAEGAPIKLYGLENRATLDASAEVVRDYIYQQDQLQRLETISSVPYGAVPSLSSSIDLSQLRKLQQMLQGSREQDWSRGLALLERAATASSDAAFLNDVGAIRQAFRSLQEIAQKEAALSQRAAAAAPGRTDNPYADVTSERVLRQKMQETEEEIESLILDQRNVETAENFLRLVREEGLSIAAIQIGARHTEGLTKELQERGVTVLVLTPSLLAEGVAEADR